MDALSKIFEDIHLHQSEYIYLNPQGDWSFQYRDQGPIRNFEKFGFKDF